jgi:hypothetical protein
MLQRHVVVIITLFVFNAWAQAQDTYYSALTSFSVWSIELNSNGSGSIEVNYVNPGSTEVHKRSLGIEDVRAGSSAKLFKGGIECGKVDVHFEQHNRILILGAEPDAHVFSRTEVSGIAGNLAELRRTAALQKGFHKSIDVVNILLTTGC